MAANDSPYTEPYHMDAALHPEFGTIRAPLAAIRSGSPLVRGSPRMPTFPSPRPPALDASPEQASLTGIQPRAMGAATAPPAGQPQQPPSTFTPQPAQPSQPAQSPSPYASASYPTTGAYIRKFSELTPGEQDTVRSFVEGSDYKFGGDWRALLESDPSAFLDSLSRGGASQQSIATHIAPILKGSSPTQKSSQLQQQIMDQATERLSRVAAVGGREDEEQLLAGLASRGLLDSGIAARELANFRQTKYSNFTQALSQLNQALLSGQLNALNARDLAELEANLQMRNQQALLAAQEKYGQQGQPDPWLQLAATTAGVGSKAYLGDSRGT